MNLGFSQSLILNLSHIPGARKLSYSRGVIIVPHGLTFYILGVVGSNRASFQTCVLEEKIFFGQEPVPSTMHVPEENSAWVTNTMKPTFHLDQVFAYF